MTGVGMMASSVVVGSTVVLDDPFNTLANWAGGSGSLVAGRTGNGMQMTGTGNMIYSIPAGTLRAFDYTISLSWRVNSLAAARPILTLRSGASNDEVSLRAETTGALTAAVGPGTGTAIGSSSTGAVAINTWYTLEFAVHVADSPNGTVRVKRDGITLINLTGVDTSASNTGQPIEAFRLLSSSGGICIFDDFLATTP